MIKLGLLGRDISHSKSALMYEEILGEKLDYQLFDYEKESEIPSLNEFFSYGLNGLSITSPFKRYFLDKPETKKIFTKFPAVNCIRQSKKGYYELYNTDYLAILSILQDFILNNEKPLNVVILGDGVMSKITEIALAELGLSYQVLSRRLLGHGLNEVSYGEIFTDLDQQSLLINCCSRDFIFEAELPREVIFWDYNYSLKPHEQRLSKRCHYIDGLEMLKLQAREALKIWGLVR